MKHWPRVIGLETGCSTGVSTSLRITRKHQMISSNSFPSNPGISPFAFSTALQLPQLSEVSVTNNACFVSSHRMIPSSLLLSQLIYFLLLCCFLCLLTYLFLGHGLDNVILCKLEIFHKVLWYINTQKYACIN